MLLELANAGVDHADELAHRGREQADDRGHRAGDCADELRAQRLGGRKLGELLDVVRADLGAVEQTALERDRLRASGVVERLRNRDRVAVRLEERDRGRPLEQREQRLDAGRLGRTLRERVLDDREARAVLVELPAELGDLRHGQAAVVGDDERLRALQALGQLRDDSFLFRFLHRITS